MLITQYMKTAGPLETSHRPLWTICFNIVGGVLSGRRALDVFVAFANKLSNVHARLN